MLLSKPFTLNYSIELYLQATETKTTKTFPWHQIKSQQNQLFISFILTILFNYIQCLLLIGENVIQKSREDQIIDYYNLGQNRNQLPHNRTLENLTTVVFKFIFTNKTSIYANKIKCVAARTLPVSEVARKRTCRQTNNSHEQYLPDKMTELGHSFVEISWAIRAFLSCPCLAATAEFAKFSSSFCFSSSRSL